MPDEEAPAQAGLFDLDVMEQLAEAQDKCARLIARTRAFRMDPGVPPKLRDTALLVERNLLEARKCMAIAAANVSREASWIWSCERSACQREFDDFMRENVPEINAILGGRREGTR